MKILKTNKTESVIETITHLTDKKFSIIEKIVNGNLESINLVSKNRMTPMFLDIPKDYFIKQYKDFYDLTKLSKKLTSIKDVNKYPVFFLYFDGHKLFNSERNIISIPYTFNYIGSLAERFEADPVYAEIIKKLKTHPFVLNLEEYEIPYYNRDFYRQKGIKIATVLTSQEKYEEMYLKYKELGIASWSVRIGDIIKLSYGTHFNLYGEEITELLKKYYS